MPEVRLLEPIATKNQLTVTKRCPVLCTSNIALQITMVYQK